jgi:hypothetical protein
MINNIFIGILGLILVGCNTMRSIDICHIDKTVADCANHKTKYQLQMPTEMIGHFAFPETSLELLASTLQTCDVEGRLPRDFDVIAVMGGCFITSDSCGGLSLSLIDGYYSVNQLSLRKIQDKLDFCKR